MTSHSKVLEMERMCPLRLLCKGYILIVCYRITNPVPRIRNLHQKAVDLKKDKRIPNDLISDDEIKRGADLALYNYDLKDELLPDERNAIERGESLNILQDPKEQILTFLVCILSSFTQGWNQSANGNLGKLSLCEPQKC